MCTVYIHIHISKIFKYLRGKVCVKILCQCNEITAAAFKTLNSIKIQCKKSGAGFSQLTVKLTVQP